MVRCEARTLWTQAVALLLVVVLGAVEIRRRDVM